MVVLRCFLVLFVNSAHLILEDFFYESLRQRLCVESVLVLKIQNRCVDIIVIDKRWLILRRDFKSLRVADSLSDQYEIR